MQEAKDLAKPKRREALSQAIGKRGIKGQKTVQQVIPEEILNGKYGKELEVAMEGMVELLHLLSLGTLILEEVKDNNAVGLNGFKLEKKFLRIAPDGTETMMPAAAASVYMMKILRDNFPDDPVLSDEDGELLARDPGFNATVHNFLTGFQLLQDITEDDAAELSKRCNTYPMDADKPPNRYWVWKSVDSKDEFRNSKQYCTTLALMEDNEPVVSVVGCPVLGFDHASRSVPHPGGCALFWAVKGQGAYTQLAIMERETGVYNGAHGLKGRSLKLDMTQRIQRTNSFFEQLGTEQVRISQPPRLRQDICADAERLGNILGSKYPKFHFCEGSQKYCWLARGDEDIAWSLNQGFYDKSCNLDIVGHAAAILVAAEAGAAVADFNGKDIDWSAGPILKNNRGIFASNPTKVPKAGFVKAMEEATEGSQKEYEFRCMKRKETAEMLKKVFSDLPNHAETEEERRGAMAVQTKGLELLQNEEEMNKIAQDSINRETPLFGESPLTEDAGNSGAVPYSGIDAN